MREARVRSLSFGDMLTRYTTRKQWVQGLSLGLSSGAVISALGEDHWPAVTPALGAIVAIVNAWSIFTNLDQKILALATLRTSWETLRTKLSDLWSKWYEDGAASRFEALRRRANDLGILASSRDPWNRKAVDRWERFAESESIGEESACPPTTE